VWISSPVAIEEAGVDEDDAVSYLADHRGQIDAGAALLVHHADLDRMTGEAEQILDPVEKKVGEGRSSARASSA
jgi:hypothetical protein